jgi:hypothetical protein
LELAARRERGKQEGEMKTDREGLLYVATAIADIS